MSGVVVEASVSPQSGPCTPHTPAPTQVIPPARSEWRFRGSIAGLMFGLYRNRPGNLPRKTSGLFHPLRKVLQNPFTSSESEACVGQPMRLELNCSMKRWRECLLSTSQYACHLSQCLQRVFSSQALCFRSDPSHEGVQPSSPAQLLEIV